MARISEQTIEQIRTISDIYEIVSEYVQLKQKGRNFFGLCPFHDEKTPSFSVNQQRQIYKCFGCGAGGGTINFIMEIERLEFIDAIKYLADRYKIELNIDKIDAQNQDARTKLIDLHEKTSHIYLKNLNTDYGKKVHLHLEKRGLTAETIKKFKLGYSEKKSDALLKEVRTMEITANVMRQSGLFIDTERGYMDRFRGRIIFSIMDHTGKVIAFAGRVFESNESAKYVNSPETIIYNKSRILYGLHASKEAIREKKSIIVVEGYLDFLQLFQAGIRNCVAISGTAFTEQHALQIKRHCNTVYLAYDGDNAGKAAAIRAGYVLLKVGISTNIIQIPAGIDPDDWVREKGKEPFLESLINSEKLLKFHFNNYSGDLTKNSEKSNFINEVLIELSQITDPITRELHAKTLSEIIQISSNSIFEALQKMLNRNNKKLKRNATNDINLNKNDVTIPLLEEDLVRLCFAKEYKIRKLLFDKIDLQWLKSNLIIKIYDKIYIHLHSKNPPEAELIMNELSEKEERNKLAEILFDLDKIEFNLDAAYDCVGRLEKKWINAQLNNLRENLKKTESNKQDSHAIMKRIEELQAKQKNLNSLNTAND